MLSYITGKVFIDLQDAPNAAKMHVLLINRTREISGISVVSFITMKSPDAFQNIGCLFSLGTLIMQNHTNQYTQEGGIKTMTG